MKPSRKHTYKILAALLAPVLLVLAGYAAAPIYFFFAEDHPSLLSPWGWTVVPGEAPYSEGVIDPAYRASASVGRDILLKQRALIQVPSLSAAIAVDGHVIWSAAVGWADLKANKPATPATLYRIGSTSKAVTGTLFARLVDAGTVKIDTPISTYIPRLPNPAWAPLTLRQLASHTAGIPSYEKNRDWMGVYRALALRDHHDNVFAGLAYFDDSPLIFTPGTDFEYSSFDVVLESAVLEAAAGAPFAELMHKLVTDPLGIETPVPDAAHPARAEFYLSDDGEVQPWWSVDLSHKLAGGGFMAKPADLAKLGVAWLDADFISPTTRRVFWTPQRLVDGAVNKQGYALNWRYANTLWWSDLPLANANHGGVSKGAMAWLVVIPAKRMALAMAINTRVIPFGKWAKVQGDLVKAFSAPRSPNTTAENFQNER